MRKLLKILPLFFITVFIVSGCDFGKAPNMDKVRDVLMEEYGEEVLSDEVSGGEGVTEGTKSGTFSFGPECDADCQEGFFDYMVIAWGENWETDVDEETKIAEYEFYLELRDQMGLGVEQ